MLLSHAGTRGETLVERFDRVAAASGDRVAVECGDARLSYAGLRDASLRLAAYLRTGHGVRRGDLVAVCLEPSLDTVVTILAILRCGAAYVPLDVENPVARNRLILGDCAPRAVVGDLDPPAIPVAALRRAAHDIRAPARPAGPATSADDVCHVIYTSGTTGTPKGVPITHRNVRALFDATADLFGFGARDVWLLYHSVAFDFSVWELWGPLLTGGRLVVAGRWDRLTPETCAGLVLERGVTVLNQTPTAFGVLAREISARVPDPAAVPLRHIVFGGEPLGAATLAPWVERFGFDRPALVNMYGLTEATVHATYHRLGPADLAGEWSSIGAPLPGFTARVVDEHGRPARRGELLLAGPQVAAGYLHRPQLTADRFGALDGVPCYRTGDLVEWHGPALTHLGRADQQVKIRGHRVELGEVAAAASTVPGVGQVCVVPIRRDGEPALACAYTSETGKPISPRAFRESLRTRIPPYMLPGRFRLYDRLPTTVNGKIDPERIRKDMEPNS
ncbi:amino acid adenylation domain-containing protein [Microtetraspora sp. NBRC 13810]|uniref:amino acid adenylation domain-containing protein n=1 Tax=Microtetraspora sp. NBRC 13810 TaxID=3030990 RepID=UPI002556707D|nr:amino acid adenylation domain-containing protein [Microtetraspora sp. NBRC 13810]